MRLLFAVICSPPARLVLGCTVPRTLSPPACAASDKQPAALLPVPAPALLLLLSSSTVIIRSRHLRPDASTSTHTVRARYRYCARSAGQPSSRMSIRLCQNSSKPAGAQHSRATRLAVQLYMLNSRQEVRRWVMKQQRPARFQSFTVQTREDHGEGGIM